MVDIVLLSVLSTISVAEFTIDLIEYSATWPNVEFGVSNEVPFCSIIVSRLSLTTMFSILNAELLKELSKSSFSA